MDFIIRPATVEDADSIGVVHVRAWQAAYRGVMPDTYLNSLRAEDRADMWRRWFESAQLHRHLLVVTVADIVTGFAVVGRENGSNDEGSVGELYAINLDPDWWGGGLGRSLLRAATDALRIDGYGAAVLWVVPQNLRARALYKSEGWTEDDVVRNEEVLGVIVSEVRYRRHLTA